MAWVMLGIAGIFEVVWATCMKYSKGFTKLSWSLLTFAGMAVSFCTRDQNTAAWYGLCGLERNWRAGLRDRWHPPVQGACDGWRLIFAALLLIGIIGLKITSA